MTNAADILLLALLAIVGGLALSWVVSKREQAKALTAERERLQLQTIRPFQEQLAKLEKESTRDRNDFNSSLEAYNAKYRKTNLIVRPAFESVPTKSAGDAASKPDGSGDGASSV